MSAQTAKTFVLVHGAWHGGWCWRRVADLLTNAGHKVFTPTLTGLGERSHLIDAKVNLSTHVTDIVNVLKWERLKDVILCGHSYGGFVISAVAERMEDAIGLQHFPRSTRVTRAGSRRACRERGAGVWTLVSRCLEKPGFQQIPAKTGASVDARWRIRRCGLNRGDSRCRRQWRRR
jgi:predicted alpha/beta hydrolase